MGRVSLQTGSRCGAYWCFLCRKQDTFSGLSEKTEAGSSWLSLRAQGQTRQAAFPEQLYDGPRASRSWGRGFQFPSCLASVGTV